MQLPNAARVRQLGGLARLRARDAGRGDPAVRSPSPLTSPIFGTLANAENIARQTASVLVLGLGMSLVVLVGGIDLSVGSVVLFSATIAGVALVREIRSAAGDSRRHRRRRFDRSPERALIEGLRISPVIVTLGAMIAVRGLGARASRRISFMDRRSAHRSSTTSRSAAWPASRSMRSSHWC